MNRNTRGWIVVTSCHLSSGANLCIEARLALQHAQHADSNQPGDSTEDHHCEQRIHHQAPRGTEHASATNAKLTSHWRKSITDCNTYVAVVGSPICRHSVALPLLQDSLSSPEKDPPLLQLAPGAPFCLPPLVLDPPLRRPPILLLLFLLPPLPPLLKPWHFQTYNNPQKIQTPEKSQRLESWNP